MADFIYQNYINLQQGSGTHNYVALNGHADLIVCLVEHTGSGVPSASADVDEADLGTLNTHYFRADADCASVTAGSAGPAYGSFDHTTVTWTAVAAETFESLVYVDKTATDTNTINPLVCNIDSAAALPLTTNGADVTWEPHVNGVFQQLSA